MKLTSAAMAAGAAVALLAVAPAQARTSVAGYDRPGLPPVSGTIRLAPETFGYHRLGRHRAYAGRFRRNGPFSGYQAGAYGQIWRGGYNTAGAETYWNRNVEFYGEGNDTLAMTVTGWGTADSATTGGAYPPPSPWHRASVPVGTSYGTGSLTGTRSHGYGYAPMGGLAYYNSGSPGGMAYYGSSSSRGPGGTPGGLGIYSSGSYGPGPKIIRMHDRQLDRFSERLNTGPHIIHIDRGDDLAVE